MTAGMLVKAHADVDIVRGRIDDASASFDSLSNLPWTEGVPELVRSRAELALWRGDPLRAIELLAPLLGYADDEPANQATGVIPSTTLMPGIVGWLLVLLARAAADAAEGAPERRVELQETTRDAAKHHPGIFDVDGFPATEPRKVSSRRSRPAWTRRPPSISGSVPPETGTGCSDPTTRPTAAGEPPTSR